ncbi:MAG: DNA gyrase subunit A [Parcubacteria group bacterium Gr01-1014_38]|nr:MAG: DNA gyrase subunit A [Parcubacteria group bacterium Gr01-1014_38]
MAETIQPRVITDEVRESYLDYAMSVIVSRALPDVRDGLKPVQRRILYAMHDMGLRAGGRFRKSAAVVGEVLGRYHPHGDLPVYEAMARLTQSFSLRHPLVDGQGNWGSTEDAPAAMRYTEARLSRLGELMLADIERETVTFAENYDRTKEEPTVLPGVLPNLLVNGTVGIAVGMATNIPPHNLREVIDALVHLAKNPRATIEDLLEYIQGPDFPTGGIVYGARDIAAAYATGKGPIVTRAKTEIVDEKDGEFRILVTEIPFQVNKAALLEEIADGVRAKRLEGIRDLRDESDKEGTRVVIELKRDAVPNKVLNQLFAHTALQRTFHVNLLALVNGIEPRVLTLKGLLEQFLEHRRVVVRRRGEYDLTRAKERAHILEGITKALDHIDAVVATIKKSETKEEAHANLRKKFGLSDAQATAILEMRLQTLAGLERKAVQDELGAKRRLVRELTELLGSPKQITGVVVDELLNLRKRFGEERRTAVTPQPVGEFRMEDLIPDEDTVVMVTTGGYVKRLPVTAYRVQRRGGKGVIGMTTKEADAVDTLFVTRTHADILFFTNLGHVFAAKAYDLPLASRMAKGQALPNFLSLTSGEKVTAVLALPKGTMQRPKAKGKGALAVSPGFLIMVTRRGTVKRVPLAEFANVRRSGLIAIRLHQGDALDWVARSGGADQMMLVTARGQSVRFKEGDVRPMGRPAAGVRAVRLKRGDDAIGMARIPGDVQANQVHVLILTEHGFGKRTLLSAYKVQRRAGSGIKTAQVTSKTGPLVGMALTPAVVGEDATIIVTSAKGQVIRVPINSIRILGRATQGVRVMRLEGGDSIASFTMLAGAG